MKRIIAGATGFIGKALVQTWIGQGVDVVVIGRSKSRIADVFGDKVDVMDWHDFDKGMLSDDDIECAVNLAGAGIADKRWSPARKKEILDSRITATKAVARYCMKHKIPLLNASAVGIYGMQEISKESRPDAFDEDTAIDDSVKDFLSSVCRAWEKETELIKISGVRTVNLRIGVVLGADGGALRKMAVPFYFFAGGPIGSGYQMVPWISLNDLCRAVDFLIDHQEICGPINLVSPGCINQKELARALGKAINRPSFMPTPAFILKIVLGQMAEELLLNGQNVFPKRLLEAGFEFENPMIEQVLSDIY